jgi:hypothetical protein
LPNLLSPLPAHTRARPSPRLSPAFVHTCSPAHDPFTDTRRFRTPPPFGDRPAFKCRCANDKETRRRGDKENAMAASPPDFSLSPCLPFSLSGHSPKKLDGLFVTGSGGVSSRNTLPLARAILAHFANRRITQNPRVSSIHVHRAQFCRHQSHRISRMQLRPTPVGAENAHRELEAPRDPTRSEGPPARRHGKR